MTKEQAGFILAALHEAAFDSDFPGAIGQPDSQGVLIEAKRNMTAWFRMKGHDLEDLDRIVETHRSQKRAER